ncbi:MAG TPA: lysophospholipid acyltransferase family protein [Chthoniobacterales bacterium]
MSPWYVFGYNLSRWVAQIFFRYRVIHPERVIQDGPVILAMNHQSYLDPPLAGIACRRAIYFLARKTLLDIPLLGPILPKLNVIPVDQEGGDRSALKAIIRLLRADQCVLVFPEGARTEDGNLQPAQAGVGFIIAKTRAPVVPMRIFGAHDALPRGGKKLRLARITVAVGEPLHFSEADVAGNGREVYPRLSQQVMDAIAKLRLE